MLMRYLIENKCESNYIRFNEVAIFSGGLNEKIYEYMCTAHTQKKNSIFLLLFSHFRFIA